MKNDDINIPNNSSPVLSTKTSNFINSLKISINSLNEKIFIPKDNLISPTTESVQPPPIKKRSSPYFNFNAKNINISPYVSKSNFPNINFKSTQHKKNNNSNPGLNFNNSNNINKSTNNFNNITMKNFSNIFMLNSSSNFNTLGNQNTSSSILKTDSFNYNTTSMHNNSSTNNIFSKFKSRKKQNKYNEIELFPLNKFSSLITESMANYKIESSQTDDNDSRNGDNYNKTKLNLFLKTNKKKNNLNNTHGENSFIIVDCPKKEYQNPLDSLKILRTNKNIYNNITTSSINIQKMYYDKSIGLIQKLEDFKKLHKVRISNTVQKTSEFLNTQKNKRNNTNNEMNILITGEDIVSVNDPMDKMSLETHQEKLRILEKEKDKEREKELKKKKKEDERLKNKLIKSNQNELYGYYKYSSKNFPEGREQFSMDYNLTDIVLFGGIVSNKNNNIWSLDPISLEWEKKNLDTPSSNPRYGHTGTILQKKLYVIGGKCKSTNNQYIADLDVFDLVENQWVSPINFNSKSIMDLRRNHVADLIGNQIIIHGGVNEDNKILNDSFILSIAPLRWTELNYSEFTTSPALMGHASAVVLPSEIKYNHRTNIYKFPDHSNGAGKIIKEKGWYLFGGLNNTDGNLCNDLYILRLGIKPVEWLKPNIRGIPPLPRYSHSFDFYEQGNFVVLHGGRNDFKSESFALSDTHILDLFKMEWSEIKVYSELDDFKVFNRCGHSSVVFSNKLIIFGGMNNLNYLGSALFIVNLDFNFQYFQKESYNENLLKGKNSKQRFGDNKKNQKDNFEKVCNEYILPPMK